VNVCRIALYRIKSAASGGACESLRWQLGHIHPGTPGLRFAAPGDRAARSAVLRDRVPAEELVTP